MITRTEYGGAYQTGFKRTIRFLISRGVPLDFAEDVAQAAWMRGWEQVSRLRSREHLKAWIDAIAWNAYRRVLRFEKRHQPLDFAHELGRQFDSSVIELTAVLDLCTSSDRELLVKQMAGFTTREMACDAGIAEGNLRVRLLRARQAAKERAQGRNVPPGNYCPAVFSGTK